TADKKAASFSIESKNLTDPIDRHAFQLHRRRRRTPDRKISVQRRGEQIGKRCHCSSGRLHVTKHAWMSVLTAKRDNGLAKNFKQTLKSIPLLGSVESNLSRISREDMRP